MSIFSYFVCRNLYYFGSAVSGFIKSFRPLLFCWASGYSKWYFQQVFWLFHSFHGVIYKCQLPLALCTHSSITLHLSNIYYCGKPEQILQNVMDLNGPNKCFLGLMWQNKTVYVPSIHIKLFYANKQNLILTIKYVFFPSISNLWAVTENLNPSVLSEAQVHLFFSLIVEVVYRGKYLLCYSSIYTSYMQLQLCFSAQFSLELSCWKKTNRF